MVSTGFLACGVVAARGRAYGPGVLVGAVRRGVAVAVVVVGACLLVAGCDPGPGGLTYRYIVSNGCGVPIRADVNGVEGVERIPRVADQDLLAPGDSSRMYDSFVEVDTIYVSVSRESASETENIYPFNLADLTLEPTEFENLFAYTFVIEGAMCPSG